MLSVVTVLVVVVIVVVLMMVVMMMMMMFLEAGCLPNIYTSYHKLFYIKVHVESRAWVGSGSLGCPLNT